jgi:HAD superfamily hydrolase (TIGR01509 family)
MWSQIAYIIFDLDGTLIDSSRGVIESTNYALESLGEKPRTDEEIVRFIGYPLDVMFPSFTKAPLDELKRAFQVKAKTSIITSVKPLVGVNDILPLLHKAGYTLGIATTKFSIHTVGSVEKCGWSGYFKALTSGDEVERVKPAPDIIHLAMKRLGADPERTVMIGDTVNDIIAAHEAGIRVIAIKSPFGQDEFTSHNPDLILDSIFDLKRIFNL